MEVDVEGLELDGAAHQVPDARHAAADGQVRELCRCEAAAHDNDVGAFLGGHAGLDYWVGESGDSHAVACLWHAGCVVAVGMTWEGKGWDLGEDRGVGGTDREDDGTGIADSFVGDDGEELVFGVWDIFHYAVPNVCDGLFVDEAIQEVVSLGYTVAVVGKKG